MKIVVAVTAASGAIYGCQIVRLLVGLDSVERVGLILTDDAARVVAFEGQELPQSAKIVLFDNSDMWSSVASGSAGWDAMIVAPCSMGTMSRIAVGVSQSLVERAADVMLKERRRLVLVVREAPFSTIHLRNMTSLSECGAVVMAAAPSFYSHPCDIESLCMTISTRALALAGVEVEHFEWGADR